MKCPFCAAPRTRLGENINPTCGRSQCQEYAFKANELFSALGKHGKTTIALQNDAAFMREFFRDADHPVRAAVIVRCESYLNARAARRARSR